MAFTVEQLQPFHKEIAGSLKRSLKNNLAAIVDYLTTGQAHVLAGITPGFDNSVFCHLVVLLKPPHEWDENDQLILDVMTFPSMWPYIWINFIKVITERVNASGTEQDWNSLMVFLQKYLPSWHLFQLLFYESKSLYNLEEGTTENSLQAKWLKDFLQAADKYKIADYIKRYSGHGFHPNFLGLLIEFVPASVDGYLQLSLANRHKMNLNVIYPALYYNSEIYLPFIIEKIKELSRRKYRHSVENRLTALMMVQSKHPGSVNDLLIEAANDYWALYPSIQRKWREPSIKKGENSFVFSELSAKILLEADPLGAKEKLWDIFQQTTYLHVTVLNLLADRLNEEALPFLLKALQADISISGVRYYKYVLDLLKRFDKDKYRESLLEFAQHKPKQVRQLVIEVLGDDEKAIEGAL